MTNKTIEEENGEQGDGRKNAAPQRQRQNQSSAISLSILRIGGNSPRPDNISAPSAPCLHNAAMSNKKYNEEQIAQHYKKERKDLIDRARFGYHFDRKKNNAPILAHLLKPHNPKEKPPNLTSQNVYLEVTATGFKGKLSIKPKTLQP